MMAVKHLSELTGTAVNHPAASNLLKKVAISPADGWDGYVLRVFELEAGGYSPRHTHDWPHINYVIAGQGTLHLAGTDHPVTAGSFAFVPGGQEHQFTNSGPEKFVFICIVPAEGDKM